MEPCAFVLVETIVVNEAEVGVLEVVVVGCVSEVGVDEVDGVLVTADDEDVVGVGVGVFEVVDCDVDEVRETGEEVEIDVEDVDSEEVVTVGVGLLLATELDDETNEELVGVDAAWKEDVADVDGTPVSVLVELEDIVNCLNLRSLGRLLYIAWSAMNTMKDLMVRMLTCRHHQHGEGRIATYLKPGSTYEK